MTMHPIASSAASLPHSRLVCLVLCLLLGLPAICAAGQPYPVKPIRLLVGFTPGGAADASARAVTKKMGESMKATFVIENRPGAGGNVAAALVAGANHDGYTLFWGSVGPLTVSPALGMKLPYDPLEDFAPVGLAVSSCNVLVSRPGFAASSVSELLALARAKPGQLNYASQGVGSTGHLAGELLRTLTGVDIVHVPYKGGAEVVTGLLGSEVELAYVSVTAMRGVGVSRMKALAVTCARGDPALPDVPSFAQAGIKSYDATYWYGLLAPSRLSAALIMQLNRQMREALADRAITQPLEVQGLVATPSSPQEFSETIRRDYARWQKVFAQSPAVTR